MNAILSFQEAIAAIDNWYLSQCDESWEHRYGAKIETTDNPGWWLNIDINLDVQKVESMLLFLEEQWDVKTKYENGNFSIFAHTLFNLLYAAGYFLNELKNHNNAV
jgi:hypothetical protein